MITAPLPSNEQERDIYLGQLCMVHPAHDEGFDRIVALTAEYFQVPIALISILEGQRQWFRASVGMTVKETPRDNAFCGHAILGIDVMEVSDATQDPRFADNPLVTGEPGIRFYAGMPLLTKDGLGLGSLCVIDTKARAPLSERESSMLRQLAGLVMGRIESLRARSYIDEPTGLYNRLRLEEDVALALERGTEVIVVVGDMLPLQYVNEIVMVLGYGFFNATMRAMKNRLVALLPQGCLLYKISPTRFAFLLEGSYGAQQATLYRRILDDFGTPVVCDGIPVRAELGLGVLPLSATEHGDSDWLRLVVSAANDARDRDLGWAHFEPRTDESQQRAFALLTGLSHAVEEDHQLWLEYQPVIDLLTGACTAVEALLRWQHPTLGCISPGEFIPLAEKTALIRPLSRWVLQKSIEQTAEWRKKGLAFKVAINVSAHDLVDPSYVDRMFALLAEHRVDPSGFKIEFTESALISDPRKVAHQLRRAHEAGITVAIDDFGTGYSNWGYLRELPASVVKIDQAFIKNLPLIKNDQLLTRSIIDMARRMGFRVVAEGIETREALDLLRNWNCDEGQGYFFARPMRPGALLEWLDSERVDHSH